MLDWLIPSAKAEECPPEGIDYQSEVNRLSQEAVIAEAGGNHTDQTTLRPALEKCIDKISFGRVIVVADGGLNNGPSIERLLDRGNGYILSKSTKKSDKLVKARILEDEGYVLSSSLRKSKPLRILVKSLIR